MPATTRGAAGRNDPLNMMAPIATPPDSPASDIVFSTPKRRRGKGKAKEAEEDEFMQFARELVADDTPVVLRDFGYREEPVKTDPTQKWCYCGITEETEVEMDEMIRCANRQCEPGWFHLRCAKLPAMPPAKFAWFCRNCLKPCDIQGPVNGMIIPRTDDGPKEIKDWLLKQKQKKVSQTKKPKAQRGMWRKGRKRRSSSEGLSEE